MKEWLAVLNKGLDLWRTYLDKKLEHYDLHLKKRRLNAIKIANEMDETVRKVFAFINDRIEASDEDWKEYYKLKNKYYKQDRKFDKIS